LLVTPRPLIFISAVSRELRSARQLVANTLTFLGYQPTWQDIFGTETGDLRSVLREKIDKCKGVVQLVGQCYGAEPPTATEEVGRVSYTQYEALYARKRGKKVWYLFIDESFPIDAHESEPAELRQLQSTYRQRLLSDTHVFHSLTSSEALEASVLKLRDDLTRLRRGVKQWAIGVTALLAIIAGLVIWQLWSQAQMKTEMKSEMAKLREGIMAYPQMESQVRASQTQKDPAALQERVYAELAKQLGLEAKLLREKLPSFADDLKRAPNASSYERANAAYVAKDYPETERLALLAADEARKASPSKPKDVLQALSLAGLAAQKHIEYARAMGYFREAEKLTDRERDPQEWANVQYAIANLLDEQGKYQDAENVARAVVEVRVHVLGSEHPDTLRSRNLLANELWRQGKYAEAEADLRKLLKLQEKAIGPEHADTLSSRHRLANALDDQGKYAGAEAEYRQVLKLREKVLGPEHPDTLSTGNNLAVALDEQATYAEAEAENRKVLKLREKLLGPRHPDTMISRNNLAWILNEEGKYAEAEADFRELTKTYERVLGPDHRNTLRAHNNLAVVLLQEGKYAEAEADFRGLTKVYERVLGPEHPEMLGARNNLAIVLLQQGKYAEAEAEIRPVIKVLEKTSGAENPDTLKCHDTFANALQGQGRYAEAEAEYRSLVKLEEKVLGPENLLTLASRSGLDKTLMAEGKDAEADMREVLKLRERVIGPDHPDALESCYDFASGLKTLNKIQEAKEFAQRAAEGARKVLGPDHPSTRKYEKLLADLEGTH
jgi:Tetratricopeptide repeat.